MGPWSDEENEAVVAAYLAMLKQELAYQHYVKAQHRKALQERFGRTAAAYEHKFRNISSVLHDLHYLYIRGYQPEGNRQQSLEGEVVRQLQADDEFVDLMTRNVDHPAARRAAVRWRVTTPPADIVVATPPGPRGVRHVDFVAREAANRSLGHAGEVAVLNRERDVLRASGRDDLARRVVHVSRDEGDGVGYDIRSWTPEGRPRLIEVKTTRRAEHWPMLVSRNEVAVSRDHADTYILARVFDFAEDRVGLYELPGAIEDTCALEPTTFQAFPKPA